MAHYTIKQTDKLGEVQLKGDLTVDLVGDLKDALKDALSKGVTELVIDMEQTTHIDSSGIGLLIAAANSMARCQGTIRVINPVPDILKLMQSMRLTDRLNIKAGV